ncbi:hypothetical protein V3C99_000672 [Haemonchus contortus]
MRTTEACIVCGHGPLVLSHLYDHLRRSHSWSETQINGEKLRIRAKKGNLHCDVCDRIYSTMHSLRHHKLKVHPSGKTSSNVICPECGQRFYTYRDLAKHCNDWHTTKPATQDFSIITGRFDCFLAFEDWKDSLESSSLTNFSKRYSVHCKDGGRRHVFVCKHARGKVMASTKADEKTNSKVSAEEEKLNCQSPVAEEKSNDQPVTAEEKQDIQSAETDEKPTILSPASNEKSDTQPTGTEGKTKHTKRILSHCPAFLRVCENADGSVTYEGCIGHLGHVVCASALRIPKTDQEEILRMLRRGLHAYEIVAKIRRERWDHSLASDKQARICYVEPKDIWRMAHRHGLVQRRYRTAKRLAAAESNQAAVPASRNEEILSTDNVDVHVQEVIDLTDDGDPAPVNAMTFFQTMQRVDTAAIEAFQTFQEINRFVNELMELCVRNNQHELISQMNAAMMIKANEIAGAIGVDADLVLQRVPGLAQVIRRNPQQIPDQNYIIVNDQDREERETKPLQECKSEFSVDTVEKEKDSTVNLRTALAMMDDSLPVVDNSAS